MALVPSVPGTGKNQHKGSGLYKYGHMRVRALLSRERVLLEEGGHKVVFQFSSFSSLTDTPVRTNFAWTFYNVLRYCPVLILGVQRATL